MIVVNDHTLDDYVDAFDAAKSPMLLEHIETYQDELPEMVKEARAGMDDAPEMTVFYFAAFVEEFDESVTCWLPMRKDVLEKLTPMQVAIQSTPLLTEAVEHAIYERREAEAGAKEEDDSGASAHNP